MRVAGGEVSTPERRAKEHTIAMAPGKQTAILHITNPG